jgi:hypothetical protein
MDLYGSGRRLIHSAWPNMADTLLIWVLLMALYVVLVFLSPRDWKR